MNTVLNTSNLDEECMLGGQTLALSESETEEVNFTKTSREISANYNDKDNTILKEINSTIPDVSNLHHKTKESLLLNEQKNLSCTKYDDTHNVINSDGFNIAVNDKTTCDSKMNSKLLDISSNANTDNKDKICTKKKSKCISYSDEEDLRKFENLESEQHISENLNSKDEKNKKISSIIDSESDEEPYPTDNENHNEKFLSKDARNTCYNTISDAEKKHNRISTIVDSESGEEDLQSNEENNYGNSEEYTNIIHTDYDKRSRQQSLSAKIASVSAIKSETQRMHRENQINVPYHKPRNCTLKEFMARKSQNVLRSVATKSIGKGLSLKMTEQELENYAKYLEKREKESEELFANEEELLLPPTTIASKEKKEENQPIYILNNDNIQNDNVNLSKIQIISDILICPPEKQATSTLNISNLKKLLAEDNDLIGSPILSGNSEYIIDLESGNMIPSTLETPKSGVDKLLERCAKSSGSKKRNSNNKANNETIKLVNGNKSLINNTEFNNNIKDRKPGASYIALKNNLRKLIFESRKNVLDKKINDFNIENKMVEQICAEEDEEDDYVTDDEENEDMEKDNYKIEENLDEENIDKNDDDNMNRNEDNNNEDADDESDVSIENDSVRNKKLSRRVIKRFEDDSDSDFEDDTDSVEYNFANTSAKESNEKQEEELLELCSGKFNLTQLQSELKATGFIIPTIQSSSQFNESQLEALCSGTFTDKVTEDAPCLNSDEDENALLKKSLNRTNKKKKTANKISYSDDEDENNHNINNFEDNINTKNYEEEVEEEVEEIQTYIDYDSDENEIQVEMTKIDCKMKAKDFFEKEAELSESEWGSADEDEKELDRYDIELGDEDEFDQDKLQSELGKIHMRKMMDEDAREVKKMQELLFDDEENDGLGRQRQFRWRKTENGFDINDNADGDQGNKESGEDDEETEEQWRKMKHEREILLMEKHESVAGNKIILSPLKLISSNQIDKINIDIDSPKILINKSKKSIDLKKFETDSPFLISKNNSGGIRGSFLKRDREILSKVAASLISSKETNNINADSSDDIGRVKSTTGKHNNFVFTILSQPQVQQTNKRKLSDMSDIDPQKSIKKTKFISHKIKKNLIDHLDLTEI